MSTAKLQQVHRVVALALVAASVIALVRAADPNTNLVLGNRQYNDALVYQGKVAQEASWIGRKVIYKQTYNATKGYVITQVRATNEVNDGTGAEVIAVDGGPGRENVTLRFKSQRLHGIYFVIELFAKPRY